MPRMFKELNINKSIYKAIDELGLTETTPIQEKAIPAIRSGVDVVGLAQTGTGKTYAYLIPLLCKLEKAEGMVPRALVLVPTRELALQVEESLKLLTQFSNIRATAVFGGIGITKHEEKVIAGIDIIIATPGRLMDIYLRGNLYTKKIKTVVFDEFDRMLDMGFMPQIRKILAIIPVKRQNLLFSATLSDKIKDISHEFLDFPTIVEVALQSTPADNIEQYYYEVPNFISKINLLLYFLNDKETFKRNIIFVKTKEIADNIFKVIKRKCDKNCRVIHSNKAQNSRINAINDFKDGDIRVLVATDISSRGIDVFDVSHVINFNIPQVPEDYVHRIGRTARAGKSGISISFVNPAEVYYLNKIQKLTKMPIQKVEIPSQVTISHSSKEEKIDIAREIDYQKRLENTDFKGAFHVKKNIDIINKKIHDKKKKAARKKKIGK